MFQNGATNEVFTRVPKWQTPHHAIGRLPFCTMRTSGDCDFCMAPTMCCTALILPRRPMYAWPRIWHNSPVTVSCGKHHCTRRASSADRCRTAPPDPGREAKMTLSQPYVGCRLPLTGSKSSRSGTRPPPFAPPSFAFFAPAT